MASVQDIPIFPLQLIAFPGEPVPLHIFEPRYRKLIADCEATGEAFGIIPVIDQQAMPVGTLVRLERVVKRYPDGRTDILARGVQPFFVERFHPKPEQEEAHRADVTFVEQDETSSVLDRERVLALYQKFHQLMQPGGAIPMKEAAHLSFQLAHTAGLSDAEKLDLLRTPDEQSRLESLIAHFEQVIPRMEALEKTRLKAQQNGDYRLFPELNINFGLL